MKSYLQPYCYLKPVIVASSLLASLGLTSVSASAAPEMPSGERAKADVDITQPIKALDTLSSLKNNDKLDFSIPKFQHFTTSNGVPVIFFQTNQLPIVDVDLRFNAGSARDESIDRKSVV